MRFFTSQLLAAPHHHVAALFGDVRTLARLTPPWPPLVMRGETYEVRPGAAYRLEFRLGPRTFTWESRVVEADPGRSFTDTYAGDIISAWRHRHTFVPSGTGTRVTDEIEYKAPLWAVPLIQAGLWFLFLYRKRALHRLCAAARR